MSLRSRRSMRAGPILGPEANSWIVPCAPTRAFTCVPPTSMTRIRAALAGRFLLPRIGGFSPESAVLTIRRSDRSCARRRQYRYRDRRHGARTQRAHRWWHPHREGVGHIDRPCAGRDTGEVLRRAAGGLKRRERRPRERPGAWRAGGVLSRRPSPSVPSVGGQLPSVGGRCAQRRCARGRCRSVRGVARNPKRCLLIA